MVPKLGDALLVLLAIVVGAAAIAVSMGYGLRDAPDSASALPPLASASAVPDRPVRALFLGGSVIAGGSRTPGTPAVSEVAAVALGWTSEVDGRLRAGFTVDGASAPRLTELTPADIDGAAPDVVVVQGGEADVAATAADLTAAVSSLVGELRQAFGPTTRLVLVGPYSPTAAPAPELVAVRDTIRAAARTERVHFLDPIAAEWVAAGDPEGLVNPGSRLPTSDGHLKIGRLLAADLERLEIVVTAG